MGYKFTDLTFKLLPGITKEGETFTPTDKLVLLHLAERANNDTGQCHPGYGRLAKDTGYHRSTVLRTIARLEQMEFITITPPGEEGGTNTYTLNLDLLSAAADAPPVKVKTKLSKLRVKRKSANTHEDEPKTFNIEDDGKQELEFLDEVSTTTIPADFEEGEDELRRMSQPQPATPKSETSCEVNG